MKQITKKIGLCVGLLLIEAILFFMIRPWVSQMRMYSTTDEFLKTIDCAEIFDANPGKDILISFEIKAKKEGEVLVYQQNGGTARYSFYEYVNVTKEYQTYDIIINPILVNEEVPEAFLTFYGEYGSGVIPTVRNISIQVCE